MKCLRCSACVGWDYGCIRCNAVCTPSPHVAQISARADEMHTTAHARKTLNCLSPLCNMLACVEVGRPRFIHDFSMLKKLCGRVCVPDTDVDSDLYAGLDTSLYVKAFSCHDNSCGMHPTTVVILESMWHFSVCHM